MIIQKINYLLTNREKKSLIINAFLSVIVSVIESVAVFGIVVFISYASNVKEISKDKTYIALSKFFNVTPIEFINLVAVSLCIFYLFRMICSSYLTYRLTNFSEGTYRTIFNKLFQTYLDAEYREVIVRGPNEILKILVSETYYFTAIISSVLVALSEVLILIFICALLVKTDLYISLYIFSFIAFSAWTMKKNITPILAKYGSLRDASKKEYHENIAAVFKNYKYIKISPPDSNFFNKIKLSVDQYVEANAKASALSILPKNILELAGYLTVIVLFIYVLNDNAGSIEKTLPIITVFALGLTRMLPSVNKIVNSVNQIYFNKNSLNVVYNEMFLSKESGSSSGISIFKELTFSKVNIKTLHKKKLLEDVSFTISQGQKIGLLGKSGSGKTTLIDSIVGLHPIDSGEVYLNCLEINQNSIKNIRPVVSYIPQYVYLFSGSVAENITMSSQFDNSKVIDTLKRVDLWETFKRRDGTATQVGESGVRLSGGQLQRIGIARALYRNAQIIIMDEPTASLDVATARVLLDELAELSKGKTLIVISHQEELLDMCDMIYKIDNHRMVLAR